MNSKKNSWSGIIPPMATPLLDQDTLDKKGLSNLVEHILSAKVSGLFILGTTGEAPALSYSLRNELIKRTCSQVANRVPVLVGITDTSFTESINLANTAKAEGASAVVLAPPYYFPAGQAELIEYVTHISQHIELPIFLYNMPSHTKLAYGPETVKELSDIPNIVGLKDSSGNMVYFHKLQELLGDKEDFSLLVGPEELLAETLLLGGDGGVAGGANLYPHLFVDLYNAVQQNDITKANQLHAKIMFLNKNIYSVGKYSSSFLKGLKCSLNIKNICSDFISEPFHRFRDKEREMIAKNLEAFESLDS